MYLKPLSSSLVPSDTRVLVEHQPDQDTIYRFVGEGLFAPFPCYHQLSVTALVVGGVVMSLKPQPPRPMPPELAAYGGDHLRYNVATSRELDMEMLGDYRLFRQGGGRGAFAHVYVRVSTGDKIGNRFIVDLDPGDPSTTTPQQDPGLFEAALDGCRKGLEALGSKGIETSAYQVAIKKLLINIVDTQPDAVCVSAILATVGAFGLKEQFRPAFSDNEWKAVSL